MANTHALQELKRHADYCAAHWMEGSSIEWRGHLAELAGICTILGPELKVSEPYHLYRTFATRKGRNDDWDTIRYLTWARAILEAAGNIPVRTPEEEAIIDEQLERA